MINRERKYSELTEKIIGRSRKVYLWFGPGFPEPIYQRALLAELEKAGLNCNAKVEKDIYYEDRYAGNRRLDGMVGDKVRVELKAISELDNSCFDKINKLPEGV